MTDLVVEAHDLCLSYGETPAVDHASLMLRAGESVALMGPSGSGKSSLLYCLTGVVAPDSGEVDIASARLGMMSQRQRSQHRLANMGMIFQFGNMVPELTLRENVMLPLQLLGYRHGRAQARADEMLDRLGVAEVAKRRTGAVSGGQAQRAAVARALVHRPPVLFADEPTGALDSVNADLVLDTLLDVARDVDAALLVVTHENRVASHCDRLITMRDGMVSATHADVA